MLCKIEFEALFMPPQEPTTPNKWY